MNLDFFGLPETYISGTTALSIPDEGSWGGDWHFFDALCHPNSRIHSSGKSGTMRSTNNIFEDLLVTNKSSILLKRGVRCNGPVFCASHTRAIVDLLLHSISRGIYPAHVVAEAIIEEKVEVEEINKIDFFRNSSCDLHIVESSD